MAEVVEHELMENVCNLKSYIKDTTELLQKLNKIPQSLPGNSIMATRPHPLYIYIYMCHI